MKKIKLEQLKFEAECIDLTRTLNEYDKIYNQSKNQINMELFRFSTSPGDTCFASRFRPSENTLKAVLAASKKKPQSGNTIIIARYNWLIKNKLGYPHEMKLPNLCITIKEGKLKRAFYSEDLTHIIKKLSYYIQVIN